jgi:ferredoxin-NADP reductase
MQQRERVYQIAVKIENDGDGGSLSIHRHWHVGTEIYIEAPENFFRLHNDEKHTVLVAGGIGITPIKTMAEELEQSGASYEIHYSGKSREDMPFYEELSELFPGKVHFYFSQKPPIKKLVFSTLFRQAGPDAAYYICGPQLFMSDAFKTAAEMGIDRTTIHTENFN